MSTISAFLHPVTTVVEKEVVVSNRFLDEKGKPATFKIRALTQEENEAVTKAATRVELKNGQRMEYLDHEDFVRRLVVAATVEPDLSSKELCDAYGVVSPNMVAVKMLLAGEFNNLVAEITGLSKVTTQIQDDDVKN